MPVNPKTAGSVCLWVEVYQQHLLPELSQIGSKVDAGSSFSDATFLIDNSVDFSHTLPKSVPNLACSISSNVGILARRLRVTEQAES